MNLPQLTILWHFPQEVRRASATNLLAREDCLPASCPSSRSPSSSGPSSGSSSDPHPSASCHHSASCHPSASCPSSCSSTSSHLNDLCHGVSIRRRHLHRMKVRYAYGFSTVPYATGTVRKADRRESADSTGERHVLCDSIWCPPRQSVAPRSPVGVCGSRYRGPQGWHGDPVTRIWGSLQGCGDLRRSRGSTIRCPVRRSVASVSLANCQSFCHRDAPDSPKTLWISSSSLSPWIHAT